MGRVPSMKVKREKEVEDRTMKRMTKMTKIKTEVNRILPRKHRFIKFTSLLLVAVTLAVMSLTLSFTAEAASSVNVSVSGSKITGAQLVNSVTCVPLRSFMTKLTNGKASITWNAETKTATVKTNDLTLTVTDGQPYIVANGRYIWCYTKNYIKDGTMMTAVRPLAKSLGASVTWNGSTKSVTVGSATRAIENGSTYYNSDDLYWLSKIISAESKGESLTGKLAVGAVIYNRVKSPDYPNTIYGVIFDRKNGVQFTPVSNGTIYDTPTNESIIAAKICMEGYIMNKDILYFSTVEIMNTCWAGRNRKCVMTIGNHAFFA